MYLTLFEKMKAVDEDFKKSKLYNMGELPRDKDEMKAYFNKAISYAEEYLEKYQCIYYTAIGKYVREFVSDWMLNLERAAKRYKEEDKHETNL